MEPVLIYVEKQKIAWEKATLTNLAKVCQSVYNAAKAIGVTATLPEIKNLIAAAKRQDKSNFVEDYIVNKLTDALMPHVVNGVPYPRSEVKKLVHIPNVKSIENALLPVWGNNAQQVFIREAKDARIELLSIVNDDVAIIDGAEERIEQLYSHYTQTDKSAVLATQLQAVADAMNTFNQANRNIYSKQIPRETHNQQNGYETSLAGLSLNYDGVFEVSLVTIRGFEQTGLIKGA